MKVRYHVLSHSGGVIVTRHSSHGMKIDAVSAKMAVLNSYRGKPGHQIWMQKTEPMPLDELKNSYSMTFPHGELVGERFTT